MDDWVAQELKSADLGDRRRERRLVKMVGDLAAQPDATVPQACGDWAATQATYDFWANPRVKAADILKAHQNSTLERVQQHQVVLAVQDTTELNFSHHPSKTGMGYLDHPYSRGLKVHSTFCVSASGVPLGLIHQQVWARDITSLGKKHLRHKKETKEKESQRWIDAQVATIGALPPETTVVTIADREADFYDFLATHRRDGAHQIIRAAHNRRVVDMQSHITSDGRLQQVIRHRPPIGQLTIELHPHPNREARSATMSIFVATVEIQPPTHRQSEPGLLPITTQVILAEEENPPLDVAPVSWLLLTTLPVDGLADALQYLRWYSYRWLIERYHYVLKSGCGLERLQLETADRLERALATYTIVAWRLLWLTYEQRLHPEADAETVFLTHEWQALYCHIHATPVPPPTAPTLKQCVRWIAQLGGFLGRKGDGEPGVKTIWRGLQRLHDISTTWLLLYQSDTPTVKANDVKKDVSKA
jgi:hypothetical protein